MKKLLLFLLAFPFLSTAQFTHHQSFGIGSAGFDSFSSVEEDATGNVYAAGSFEGVIDADPGVVTYTVTSNGEDDALLVKYEPSGVVSWANHYGDTGVDHISNIAVDNTGHIIISGYFEGNIDFGGGPLISTGDYDLFIAKLDPFGQHVWSRRLGGIDESTQLHMAVDITGNTIVLAGSFSDSMDVGAGMMHCFGSTHPWIAMLDGAGNTLWSRSFGGTGFATDRATSVALDGSGNTYVTGTIGGNADVDPGPGTFILTSLGSADIFLVKYDPTGALANAFSIGGLKGEVPFNVTVSGTGDVYLTGYSNSDTLDVDPDPLAGTNLDIDTALNNAQDFIISKYDSTFDFQWAFRFGKRGNDIGHKVRVDAQGNVIVAGIFSDGSIDFDPGPGEFLLTADSILVSNHSPFLAHYDSDGNFVDAFAFEDSLSIGSVFLSSGRVWTCGAFRGVTLDPDPGAGAPLITNAGDRDAFVAAYNYPLNIGIAEVEKSNAMAYPNPCRDWLRINTVVEEVWLMDITGRMISKEVSTNGMIDVADLANGVYSVSDASGSLRLNVVKSN